MAVRYRGGEAVPVRSDSAAKLRKERLRALEYRLKQELRAGYISEADVVLSRIMESAQPGDIDMAKAEAAQKVIREAQAALNKARAAAYNGSLVTQ